jgi:hypothetical protein
MMNITGKHVGSNLEALHGLCLVKRDFIIPLVSTGTGVTVSTLKLTVSANTSMSISGNGYFYDDVAGTINQSRTISAGTERTFYVKVTSGSCNLTIFDGYLFLISVGNWSSSTNGPSIYQLNLSSLPRVLTFFSLVYTAPVAGLNNTITGNIGNLPPNITTFIVYGANTISGNISGLPSTLTNITVGGFNTITGNLSGLKNGITTFSVSGLATYYGNIGSLPSSLITFMTGTSLTGILTGNLSSLPAGLTSFWARSANNTITGSLNSLPSNINNFWVEGSNTIDTYIAGRNWPSNMSNFILKSTTVGTGLTSTEVDNLLIDLDSGNTWAASTSLTITGVYHAARTFASNAAVTSLQGKGVTVTTN